MTNNVELLRINHSDIWNTYLKKLPIEKQDIYYTPEYYQVYQNYGDGEALCFVYQDKDNIALYPFFKNSVNKLGYKLDAEYFDIQGVYGYNGVLFSSEERQFKNNFFKAFNQFCKEGNIIAEFTRFHPLLKNHGFSEENMEVFYDRKTVFLEIPENIEDVWAKSYSSNNRNMIRKALKNDVTIVESQDKEDYLSFYKIYVETMKNVSSIDYLFFNEAYFNDFIKLLPKQHKLILAKLNNKIIGGMILMFYNQYAHYHLSARKSEYGSYALNNLFLDYAIKEAKKNNCKLFHFGGGTTPNEKDSLLKFKANFSKDKSDFYIGKKIYNTEVYQKVITLWEEKNPNKKVDLKNILLKYRM